MPVSGPSLPIAFTSAGGATSVVFTLDYDPALLSVTGVAAGTGLPPGATAALAMQTLADGRIEATVTVPSPTAIAAGTVQLASLTASVPATAPYGTREALTLAVASVNGVAQALPSSAAVQLVGSLGDADGTASTRQPHPPGRLCVKKLTIRRCSCARERSGCFGLRSFQKGLLCHALSSTRG